MRVSIRNFLSTCASICFCAFLCICLVPMPASADSHTFEITGVAWQVRIETVTPPSGPALKTAYGQLRDGSGADRQVVCHADQYGYLDPGCLGATSTGFIGNCTKVVVHYGPLLQFGGYIVEGYVYSCTNPHTGKCQSVTGDIDLGGQHVYEASVATGGCQY